MTNRIEHEFTAPQAAGFEIDAVTALEPFTARTEVYYCGVLLTLGTDYTQTETTVTFTIRFVAGDDVEVLVNYIDESNLGDIEVLLETTEIKLEVADTSTIANVATDTLGIAILDDAVTTSVLSPTDNILTVSEPAEGITFATTVSTITIADEGIQGPPGAIPTPLLVATQAELDALTPAFADEVYITASFNTFTQGFYRFGLTAFERQSM